jgi:hypothetical protein
LASWDLPMVFGGFNTAIGQLVVTANYTN